MRNRRPSAGTYAWLVASIYLAGLALCAIAQPVSTTTMRRLYAVGLLLTLAAFWIDRLSGGRK